MEGFKKEIRKRMHCLQGFIAAAALIGAYDYFMIRNMVQKSISQKVAIGFQIVILVGVGILACIYLIKLGNTICNEEKLALLYARENEEHIEKFLKKSGMPMILITSMCMVLAGAVAAYFSILMFYTLVAAAALQMAAVAGVYFSVKRKQAKENKKENTKK
ncbi:MAG: hypothetical protein Q4B90_09530 [Eubacteriales bacterium]|nr:hypothetical protein [Eubacteriales bacterium]